jgi:DNA adenine methylase
MKMDQLKQLKRVTQPLLRWAGSKKKLLPYLIAASPKDIRTYIEPFVGSGVLSLNTVAQARILNDLNHDLIGAYESLRSNPRKLWEITAALPCDEASYYDIRTIDPLTLAKRERAARFIYLNRFCFNGVYRTNQKGLFNVPRGSGALSIPGLNVFADFAQHVRSAELSSVDFEEVTAKAKAGDFVYLDPPYALGEKRDRGEYGRNSFREKDEARLIKSVRHAAKSRARVLLSYSNSESVMNALSDWHIVPLRVARSVAGFSDARRTADEILVSNYRWSLY